MHMWTCGIEPETTLHYLLRCNVYSIQRLELLNYVCILNLSLKCTLMKTTYAYTHINIYIYIYIYNSPICC